MRADLRARAAMALVRWWSRWIQAAYQANCDGLPRLEACFAWGSRRVGRFAYGVATRLDREAMAAQMITEGWWG